MLLGHDDVRVPRSQSMRLINHFPLVITGSFPVFFSEKSSWKKLTVTQLNSPRLRYNKFQSFFTLATLKNMLVSGPTRDHLYQNFQRWRLCMSIILNFPMVDSMTTTVLM